MPSRIGSSGRPGVARARPAAQTYEGTVSGYGASRGDSVGLSPRALTAFPKAPLAYPKIEDNSNGTKKRSES